MMSQQKTQQKTRQKATKKYWDKNEMGTYPYSVGSRSRIVRGVLRAVLGDVQKQVLAAVLSARLVRVAAAFGGAPRL